MHQEKSLYNNFLIFFFLRPLPWFLQRRNEKGENQKVQSQVHNPGLRPRISCRAIKKEGRPRRPSVRYFKLSLALNGDPTAAFALTVNFQQPEIGSGFLIRTGPVVLVIIGAENFLTPAILHDETTS